MDNHSARWKLTRELRLRGNASALDIDPISRFEHIGPKGEGDPSMLLGVTVAKQPAGKELQRSSDRARRDAAPLKTITDSYQTKPHTFPLELICRDKGLSVVGR